MNPCKILGLWDLAPADGSLQRPLQNVPQRQTYIIIISFIFRNSIVMLGLLCICPCYARMKMCKNS